MAKLKLDPKVLELAKNMDRTTANKVGALVKEMVIEHCARGVSPVAGAGKFKGYKDKEKYPGDKKGKSPATLILTGWMLESLWYGPGGVGKLLFGYLDENDIEYKKAKTHNFGTDDVPKRPFIPQFHKGEKFTQTIMRAIIDTFNKRVQNLLKK